MFLQRTIPAAKETFQWQFIYLQDNKCPFLTDINHLFKHRPCDHTLILIFFFSGIACLFMVFFYIVTLSTNTTDIISLVELKIDSRFSRTHPKVLSSFISQSDFAFSTTDFQLITIAFTAILGLLIYKCQVSSADQN